MTSSTSANCTQRWIGVSGSAKGARTCHECSVREMGSRRQTGRRCLFGKGQGEPSALRTGWWHVLCQQKHHDSVSRLSHYQGISPRSSASHLYIGNRDYLGRPPG